MPQNSTRSRGAITSRSRLFLADSRSALLGRPQDVAARLLVRLKLDQPLVARFLEQVGERAEAVVGLVEARVPALERLLHHRAPDLLARAALGHQRFQRAEHQVEGLLLLVLPGGRGVLALLGGAAL